MDTFNLSSQERNASARFADSDNTNWTIVKNKKKIVKGIWSFDSERTYINQIFGYEFYNNQSKTFTIKFLKFVKNNEIFLFENYISKTIYSVIC